MSPAIYSRGCLCSGIPVAGVATYCFQALGRGYVQTRNYYFLLLMTFLLSGVTISSAVADSNRNAPLTLEKALSFALENDAWLSGSRYVQQATEAMSESAYQLPDPKFSVALANLPTDTLDFDQEAMTQLVFGVSQKYPRGDTRRLKRQQLQQQSERQPFMRQERKAKLKLTITQFWLDAYLARQSVALIEQDWALFDQLVDISLASYSTVMGRTRQQDLIKAQLEKTRIEDRLTKLRLMQEMKEQKLLEWLTPSLTDYSSQDNNVSVYAPELPRLNSKYAAVSQGDSFSKSELANHLVHHPSVRKLDKSIDAAGTSVKLAKQKYKPEWGVSASYGYRGDDLSGRDRADLFSAGVTVSMPLFSSVKQDKEVEAAIASQEKIKTDRSLILKKMLAGFHSARTQLERLDQRQQLYQNKLLPQVGQQAQAALNAYESDAGSFTEVVRTRIAELNARIDYLEIKVRQQKQIAQLNYFLTSSESEQSVVSGTGVAR